MDVGARGQPVHARIHLDEARATAHRVHDRMPEKAVWVGLERCLTPHDDALRQLVALVVPAARQCAGIVPLGIRGTRDVGSGSQTRRVARIAGLHVAIVRGAEHHRRVQRHGATLAAGACHADNGLRPVLLANALVVLLHDGEGLVPAALAPRVFLAAVGAVAFHRLDDARGVVHVIFKRDASRAQTPLRHGVVLVAFHVLEPAVLVHIQFQAAAHRMASRRRPRASARDGHVAVLVAPRLADVVHVGKRVKLHHRGGLVIA